MLTNEPDLSQSLEALTRDGRDAYRAAINGRPDYPRWRAEHEIALARFLSAAQGAVGSSK
jgi:hypothetical protein